jgi:hypothetical protein
MTFGEILGTNLVGKCLSYTNDHKFGTPDPELPLAETWDAFSDRITWIRVYLAVGPRLGRRRVDAQKPFDLR